MKNQHTRRDVLKGLAGIVGTAGLGGLMAILPASQVSCTNTRQAVESYEGRSGAYEAIQKIANENPKTFEKSLSGSTGVIYHDSSLKVGRGIIVQGVIESGKGRYVTINADGDIDIGYIGNESFSMSYNKAKGELVIYDGKKFIQYSDIKGRCRKGVYSGSIEGMKTDGIPFKDIGEASKKEVNIWIDLVEDIPEKFPAKRSL